MCLAPIGSIPLPIDMDGLAIGIELAISGIGDLAWLAAADGLPDEPQAAATSATAATPTPALTAGPGRGRPGDAYLDIGQTSSAARTGDGHHHRQLQGRPL